MLLTFTAAGGKIEYFSLSEAQIYVGNISVVIPLPESLEIQLIRRRQYD
jgi:hypothetical protein